MCFETSCTEDKGQRRELLSYRDWARCGVTCPGEAVHVDCCGKRKECCCPGMSFRVDSCRDWTDVDLCASGMSGLGRIIRVDVTIRDVCPGKRVAAAVILTEEDGCGEELPRGMKTFTLPAHSGELCRDMRLKCIEFVVPEDLKPDCCCAALCGTRRFRARVIANYIDTDYEQCCTQAAVL